MTGLRTTLLARWWAWLAALVRGWPETMTDHADILDGWDEVVATCVLERRPLPARGP